MRTIKEKTGLQNSYIKGCPACDSENVRDMGIRAHLQAFKLDGSKLPEPTIPIYKCNECGFKFRYLGPKA